jgi:hypothetical protein
MARINDGTLKDWKDGDKVTADLYEADREILRAAINDTDSKTNANTTTASDHTKRITDLEYNVTGTVVPMTFKELGMQNLTFDDIKLGYVDKQIEKAWQPMFDSFVKGVSEDFTATDGQTVFTTTNGYTTGTSQIMVEVDGVPQDNSSFTETDSHTVTLSEPLVAGQKVRVTIGKVQPNADARFSSMGDSITSLTSSLADITKHVKTVSDLTSSVTSGKNLIVMNGTYTLTADLTSMSNGIVIEGQNNTIIDGGGKSINILDLQNVIFKNIIFQNFGNIQLTNPVNVEFNHCQFNNFVTYGVTPINYTNIRFINGCKWNGIGNGSVNETYQGAGIYANGGSGLVVEDFEMSNTYGQGAVFLVGGATNFSIKRFNIHDTAFRGINSYTGTYSGVIEDGFIYNTGSINTKGSGVGCNGIFAYATADQSGVVARKLRFKNVYENAMECGYGMIEDIIIDGTGTDLTNHPTPSIEGIWIQQKSYLRVIRNIRIRNAAGSGIKYFDATTPITNLHIYKVVVEDDNPNFTYYGIDLNSQSSYSNVIVDDVTVINKTPSFMANKPMAVPVYMSGVKSLGAGVSLPNANQLRTKDGLLLNAIQNKDFSSWATSTTLSNWTPQSATLSQVVDDNSYIPQITVTAGGFVGRIVQDIYLPKGLKSYYLRVMFKGNSNMVLKVTPYNIDGTTLNNGAASTITSSSFSSSAFQELTLLAQLNSSKVQVYFGTASSIQGDNITIQSIQERIIY